MIMDNLEKSGGMDALRGYLAKKSGGFVGLALPGLALAGYMALNGADAGYENADKQPYTTTINNQVGSATHAKVNVAYDETPINKDGAVSYTFMRWSTQTDIIPAASEAQCALGGVQHMAENKMFSGRVLSASIDCMKDDEPVSHFTCVAKAAEPTKEGEAQIAITCSKDDLWVMNDQEDAQAEPYDLA